jgi:glyoxylase-like metal-dependent hydrolase (beta-lactamase superfamily II)
VTEGIWALVGPLEQRNSVNLGNNATFGLIETSDGAVLIDPGGSARGAAMIDEVIQTLTDEPLLYVINTGGQDHRWLGNAYWQAKGAQVIAASQAVEDQKERSSIQMTMLSQLIGEGLDGTDAAYADITFEDAYTLEIGGKVLEIRHPASAHTPGDSFVWIAEDDTLFAGDIVYVGRILGVMGFSNSAAWLEAFEAIDALTPKHLIPGHGPATDLETARTDTYEYLKNLRSQIRKHIEADGAIIDSVKVDQSAFSHLDQFEALAGRNAQAVFEQMEWE